MKLALVAGLACLGAALLAGRRLVDLVEVEGHSMAPTLEPGDCLLVEAVTYRARRPRVGDVVLADDPRLPSRELIKRIAAVDPAAGSALLVGDAPDASTDSRTFGVIPLDAIRWRAVGRYWPAARASLMKSSAAAATQAFSSGASI